VTGSGLVRAANNLTNRQGRLDIVDLIDVYEPVAVFVSPSHTGTGRNEIGEILQGGRSSREWRSSLTCESLFSAPRRQAQEKARIH
jgi:hypothetical protein